MQEQQYQSNGGKQSGLVKFLLGLFTGAAVAAPVTALAVKKICDRNKEEEISRAVEEAENRGIQAGIEVAVEESMKGAGTAEKGLKTPNKGISEGVSGSGSTVPDIPVYVEPIEQVFAKGKGADITVDETYMASLQSPAEDPGEEDINNYDLTIDDEEATIEASEFSEQHARYLDMIEKYKASGGTMGPMAISREEFQNNHIFEKSYVNWYEEDDVFEENDSKIDDPYSTFGFTSGKDMFAPDRASLRDDPDAYYCRNMRISTDFEITRMHGSYSRDVYDGGVYYNGEADSQL